jgi:ABC-type tungstate transport system substrate-binding protein
MMPENLSALDLVPTGDPALFAIVRLSLVVSLSVLLAAQLVCRSARFAPRFRGRRPSSFSMP